MQTNYRCIPFFHYHRTGEGGEKTLVNHSRFIKSKEDGEPDVIQILIPQKGKQLPNLPDGSRCLCRFEKERYTDTGTKIEEYSFGCVLPEQVTFSWDEKHTCWSYNTQIGNRTFVFCSRKKDQRNLPIAGSSATVQWKVKPYQVDYASTDAKFFIVRCHLVEELTSDRAIRRQYNKGQRVGQD